MLAAMDATGVATIAGAVLGPVVAITAIVAGEVRGRSERKATVELASAQHLHEREMQLDERLFEKRAEVYESLQAHLYDTVERVRLTRPLLTYAGDSPMPPETSDEAWRWMEVRLRSYGSPEVEAAFMDFLDAVRRFNLAVFDLDQAKEEAGTATKDARLRLDERREAVYDARGALSALIRDDLTRP
jgi:hypothetical protein